MLLDVALFAILSDEGTMTDCTDETTVLPQDPRVPGTSRYDRQEVVGIVTDFYKFLIKLPYIEPADLPFPPASGWSNISKKNFASLDKSG